MLIAGALTCLGYFVGVKVGFALTFGPHPVAVMWPPNAILLAALLLTPVRHWWFLVLAVLPAHLAAEAGDGVPLRMVMCWFVSNCAEAGIGAGLTRYFIRDPIRFDRLRDISLFFFCGAFLSAFFSSFLDAAFVKWNRWGNDTYSQIWRMRFCSNVFASMTIVPVIVTWARRGLHLRKVSKSGLTEGVLLILGLLITSLIVFFWLQAGTGLVPSLLYAPLPFLLWAALRFGTRGASTAILAVALLAIWSSVHAHGPFLAGSPEQNALSIQLFVVVISITLMPLACVAGERRMVEEALHSSEERYREVVESQTDLVCRFLADTTLTFVNRAYCNFFRRSREQLIGRKFLELVPTANHESTLADIASIVMKQRTLVREHEVLLPDQTIGWQQWINHPIIGPDGHVREIQGIGRDVTERKRAEEALRESEERNRATLQAIPDLMFLFDKSGVYLDYHARDRRSLLVPPSQFLGRNMRDVMPANLAGELARCFETVLRTGRMMLVEYTLPIHGVSRCYEARIVQCGTDKILTLVRDITERKEAQDALKQSEERYREVVETQTELVSRLRPDTTITFVNEAYCQFFGQKREELIGRKFLDIVPLEMHDKVMNGIASAMEERQPVVWEHVATLPDGSHRWQQWTSYAIADAEGNVKEIQAIGRDITDRKLAEEATQNLTHASRLAVVGELTAIIAHEVSQPLNAILHNTEAAQALLKLNDVPLDDVREILGDIHKDDLRAGESIRRIRALSQRREMKTQSLDLNRLIEDIIELTSGDALRRRVQIRTQFDELIPPVNGDPVHVQQVILNLIVNGMDAMKGTPENTRRLTIHTGRRGEDEVLVTVDDHGPGIRPELLPRIFDSFFSTKESGMGLGLSIARSIVEAHRGRIWAENNADSGVRFKFTLPAHKASTPPEPLRVGNGG